VAVRARPSSENGAGDAEASIFIELEDTVHAASAPSSTLACPTAVIVNSMFPSRRVQLRACIAGKLKCLAPIDRFTHVYRTITGIVAIDGIARARAGAPHPPWLPVDWGEQRLK
jgi:hypothetical protein